MAAKLSKEVTDSLRACLFVLSAFVTEGAHVAANLLEMTQPHLEDGDEPPGFHGVLIAIARAIKAAIDRLVSADVKLYAALALESSLRAQQVDVSNETAFLIVGLRRTVIGQYVKPDLQTLGLQALDARDAPTVTRRSELIGERFQRTEDGSPSPAVVEALGEPRFDVPVDVWPYAEQVREAAAKLSGLNDELNKARRQVDRARQEKYDATGKYNKLFLRGTRVFEDMCRLAPRRKTASIAIASMK